MDRQVLLYALAELKTEAESLKLLETELLRQVDDARASQKSLAGRIADLTNRVASISALPDEILVEIFAAHSRDAMGAVRSVILISHVNRRWRDVTISTPALWTLISHSVGQPLALLEALLKRSQECPLFIELRARHTLSTLSDMDRVLDRIVPHVSRFRQLSFRLDSVACLHRIASRFRDLTASRLKGFHLLLDSELSPSPKSRMHMFAGGAPVLEHVVVLNPHLVDCWPPLTAVKKLLLLEQEPTAMMRARDFHDLAADLPALTRISFVIPSELDGFAPIALPEL